MPEVGPPKSRITLSGTSAGRGQSLSVPKNHKLLVIQALWDVSLWLMLLVELEVMTKVVDDEEQHVVTGKSHHHCHRMTLDKVSMESWMAGIHPDNIEAANKDKEFDIWKRPNVQPMTTNKMTGE